MTLRWIPVAAALVLAAAVGSAYVLLEGRGKPEGPEPQGFLVYHFASDPYPVPNATTGGNDYPFLETFRVYEVRGEPLPIASLEMRRDGEPWPVTWEDPDENGVVSPEDTFAFVAEAMDTKHVLTAHLDDLVVMECRYGGGAGHPAPPEVLREAGLLKCLQFEWI